MLDGMPLIDAHQHPVRLPTVKPAWMDWAERFGQPGWREAYTADGEIIPRFGERAGRSGAAAAGAAGLPRAHRGAGARRQGLVVRRGGLAGAAARERVDRAVRPATAAPAPLLRAVRPAAARPQVHLRHGLARRARHRAQRPRASRPRPGRRRAGRAARGHRTGRVPTDPQNCYIYLTYRHRIVETGGT